MATSWSSLNILSQPQWSVTPGTNPGWQRYPPIGTSLVSVGFGEGGFGGFGQDGFGGPAVNVSVLSQPTWTPWTTD